MNQNADATFFDEGTDPEVQRILEETRLSRTRIRVYYGDPDTGRDWLEEHNVTGYVGRSTGTKKIPILVHNKKSLGGMGLLTHRILKIKTSKGGRVLYQHPLYQVPNLEVEKSLERGAIANPLPYAVIRDKQVVVARFTSRSKAEHYVKKMTQ